MDRAKVLGDALGKDWFFILTGQGLKAAIVLAMSYARVLHHTLGKHWFFTLALALEKTTFPILWLDCTIVVATCVLWNRLRREIGQTCLFSKMMHATSEGQCIQSGATSKRSRTMEIPHCGNQRGPMDSK